MPADGSHPWFDDHRAIPWHEHLADALAEAARSGRRVFALVGRASCGGTRALVEKTIWKEEIAEFVNARFVAAALDADAPDADLAALLPSLAKREPTPLCVYLAADGRVLHATAGGRPAAVLLQDLVQAVGKK